MNCLNCINCKSVNGHPFAPKPLNCGILSPTALVCSLFSNDHNAGCFLSSGISLCECHEFSPKSPWLSEHMINLDNANELLEMEGTEFLVKRDKVYEPVSKEEYLKHSDTKTKKFRLNYKEPTKWNGI